MPELPLGADCAGAAPKAPSVKHKEPLCVFRGADSGSHLKLHVCLGELFCFLFQWHHPDLPLLSAARGSGSVPFQKFPPPLIWVFVHHSPPAASSGLWWLYRLRGLHLLRRRRNLQGKETFCRGWWGVKLQRGMLKWEGKSHTLCLLPSKVCNRLESKASPGATESDCWQILAMVKGEVFLKWSSEHFFSIELVLKNIHLDSFSATYFKPGMSSFSQDLF